MNITLKNVKTWRSFDGGGWQASIYVDGTIKMAIVTNEGYGGPLKWQVINPQALHAWAAFHHVTLIGAQDVPCDSDLDAIVLGALDQYDANKWLAKQLKTKTLFRLPSDPPYEWRTITLTGEKGRQYVQRKYPEAEIAHV
jgi:hypothetical protein